MILFRADGNKILGTGHIMRCLSIADAVREMGQECYFVTADDVFSAVIENRGYKCFVLGSDYTKTDDELPKLLPLLKKYNPTAIVSDSYFVTSDYLKAIGEFAPVYYVDDLCVFPYPVKAIVNYNIYGPNMDYRNLYSATSLPEMLLGPQYAPLRKGFRDIEIAAQKENVSKILVLTGGSDSEHVAYNLAKAVPDEYQWHFVIGMLCEDGERLKELCKVKKNITLHSNVKNMEDLMASSDVAVSAAGSTQYELCACGVPTVNYVLADNQINGMNEFCRQQVMISAGDIRADGFSYNRMVETIVSLCKNKKQRQEMSDKSHSLVDGYGAKRIAAAIIGN